MKSYKELISLPTFRERYEYLKCAGPVPIGRPTKFRWLNQNFYRSEQWKRVCRAVTIRDKGCDLAIPDRPIFGRPRVHHLNPVTLDDLEKGSQFLLDLDNLVCVSHDTHNAIHSGNDILCWFEDTVRRPNDTCPWKEG